MSAKKSFKGLFNWTFLIIVLVGVILVNIISSFIYKRLDMTEDQRYSLSQGTIDFLKTESNFPNRLTLTIYLEGNLPSEIKHFRNAVEDKLKEFKQYAGDRIEYRFIDPNTGTEAEQQELHQQLYNQGTGILPMDLVYAKDGSQSQMLIWPGAVINYEGSSVNIVQLLPGTIAGKPNRLEGIGQSIQNSINNLEYILISSIRRAVQKEKKKVGFLQGHGELSFAQTQRVRALISPYYSVEDVTIGGKISGLDGYDGLVIAGPRSTFDEKDLFVIDQFLMNGGRLMCFLDALELDEDTLNAKGMTHTTRVTTGLERVLFDYGLKLNENYVMDARCAPKSMPFAKNSLMPWFFHVLATPTSHPISRNLEPVSLKYSSEIQFVGASATDSSAQPKLRPILTSSTNSTVTGLAPMVSLGLPLNFGTNPELVPNPDSESNKRCLSALAEGLFESHYKNRIVDEYTNNPDARYSPESKKKGKVFLVGNSNCIANQYDSMINKMSGQVMYRPLAINELRIDPELAELQIPLFFGNQEFFQNTVDYMMGDDFVVGIRSRQIDIHELDKLKVQEEAGFYKFINMVLPSFLVILFAIVMNIIRRRKYIKA